jgi:DNA-binding CsgD family transcriptional regulator
MTRTGRVLTTNDLFNAMPMTFLPSSHGGLAISDAEANRLFQGAVEAAKSQAEPLVRSIPIAAREDHGAVVVHVLPLRRAAHDIFSGGDLLIVATAVLATGSVPSPNILMGLFDLTPAEVKLAIALASGRTVQQAALDASITLSSARTYLDRIFRKTGTHQQSQLVALLKSAQSFTTR